MANLKFFLPLDDDETEELMLSDDVWRLCPSYPGYEASYQGWVRSWIAPGQGHIYKAGQTRANPYFHEGRVLNVHVEGGGTVRRNRAQLVADAFLVQPKEHWQLRYIDGNNRNFKATNLEWEARQDRVIHVARPDKLAGRTHCLWGHPVAEGQGCVVCARTHSSMYSEKRRLKRKGLPFEHVTFEYVLKRRGDWVDPADRVVLSS